MGLKHLSTSAENKIDSKNIIVETNVLINGAVIPDVSSYSYSIDKSFGVASLVLQIANREHLYSVGGAKEVKQGDNVKVQRSIILDDGSKETFETNWVVRQVNPSSKSAEDIIEVTCLDFLVKAEETDVDLGLIEGTKVDVHDMPGESYNLGVPLVESSPHPDTLPSNFAQFFDFGYWLTCATPYFVPVNNIAPWPAPIIRIVQKTSGEKTIQDSFEINYETGQLILPAPICTDDFEIWAVFSYYSTGLRAEDVIKQILLEPDGYGNTIYSDSDFETTLNDAIGKSTDISNILDTLTEGDFSVPAGGGSITEINKEAGYILLENEIASDSNVICTKNYLFNTLQYSGITIPFIRLSADKIANRFEAINSVKQYLPPNYVLMTLGDNKLWGRYLAQKPYIPSDSKRGADYKLNLIGSLSYNLDEDIYTHVKVFGKSNNPHNIMQDPGVTYDGSYLLLTYGENMPLVPVEFDTDSWPNIVSTKCRISPPKQIVPNPKPIITVDGIQIQANERTKARSEDWGRIKIGDTYIGYTFSSHLDFNDTIKFYYGDSLITEISSNILKPEIDDRGNLYYSYYPNWSSYMIEHYYPDFYVVSNSDFKIDYNYNGYISIKNHYKITGLSTLYYRSSSPGYPIDLSTPQIVDLIYYDRTNNIEKTIWSGTLQATQEEISGYGLMWKVDFPAIFGAKALTQNYIFSATNYYDSVIKEWRLGPREYHLKFYNANNDLIYQKHIFMPGNTFTKYFRADNWSKYVSEPEIYTRVELYCSIPNGIVGFCKIENTDFYFNAKISSYYLTPSEHSQEEDRYKLHDKNPLTQLQIGYKTDPGSLVLISFDLQEEKDIDIIDFSTGFYKFKYLYNRI